MARFKIGRPHVPDVGKMGQYNNFNGDKAEEAAAKKRIKKYVSGFGIAALVAGIALVVVVYQSGPESGNGSNGSGSGSGSEVSQYASGGNGGSESEDRYDEDVSTAETSFSYVNGDTITGAYSKSNYELSVDISEELAKKYSEDFSFYYIVAEASKDNEFYMSYQDSENKVFKVSVEEGGVSDNLYSLKYLTSNDTQMWADNYGDSFKDLQGITRSQPEVLLGKGGLDMGSMNDIQIRTSPDVVIFVSSKYEGGSTSVESMFQDILGDEEYAKEFKVTVVELSSEDGVYEHLYEDKDVTTDNYKTLLSVKTSTEYTVGKDGSV